MILQGDCREVLRTLEADSVQCCVTSPPYWGLRDYGVEGQLGLEPTPEAYVTNMVEVFREVRRVLRPDGVLWLNLGDSYLSTSGRMYAQKETFTHGHNEYKDWERKINPPGLKPKDLVGIPWRAAFALQADGWWLRSDIIWSKPNPMPESVTDRPTKAHEYLFLLTKSERYYYDADAIAERVTSDIRDIQRARVLGRGGQDYSLASAATTKQPQQDNSGGFPVRDTDNPTRNARSVWEIATRPYAEAHFATFPPELARRCILAGSRPGDTVLDPFNGAGTTGLVAQEHNRRYIGIELNPDYIAISDRRLAQNVLPLLDGAA